MSNRFLLEAKNIIKTFPPTVALNDVHFCLRPGEIHGLMGENGSGIFGKNFIHIFIIMSLMSPPFIGAYVL